MSEPLPRKKVEEAIERLPKALREKAAEWYNTKMPYRHGSDFYGRHHPKHQVTDEQRKFMWQLRKHKMSYRTIEEIMHLKAASGNDALRCITQYEQRGKSSSTQIERKPRMTLAQLSRLAQQYAKAEPAKTKAAFKPVMEIFSNKTSKTSSQRHMAAAT